MIAAHISKRFKNSIWNRSTLSYESHDLFSISIRYFSTSVVKKPLTNSLLLEILLNKHQFSPQAASQVASALSTVRIPQNSDAMISFFKETGFSESQVVKIAKYRPQLLSGTLKNIKPKIKIFQDLGYTSDELAELISDNPWILRRGPTTLIPSISVLKGFLGSNAEVARLLKVSTWFLSSRLGKCLEPNVEFLTSCGIPSEQLVSIIFHFPRFILTDPENLRKCVKKADEMEVNRGSKMFVHAVRVLAALTENTWLMKLQSFRDIGFSEEDILRVFRKAPVVFTISDKKMKKVTKLVRSTGKYDISAIVANPTSLCRSIEKWYKPRFDVLETLESKNLIKSWPSFATFCRMQDKVFVEKYVAPYIDVVGDIYYRKV